MDHQKVLDGRRLYFVGIGGSGMSAYANIARALGAEVRGWDLRDTIFLGSLAGIDVDLGGEPTTPDGWEAIVSTAHQQRIAGTSRADFLAELVAAQPAIVVGGAHGKTTTSAMIAFVLAETGRDPAWIIGGIVPQLGGNAGVGAGWLVVEGDESDRSIGSLAPQIAVSRTSSSTITRPMHQKQSCVHSSPDWLETVPHVVRSWELAPVELELAVPGDHNRQNAAAALAALDLAGVPRPDAEAAIVRFAGVGRRFELVGEQGGVTVYDDYGHNPTELEVTLRTARSLTSGRVIAVYQPHVVERTRQLHHELGEALGLADAAIVTDIIGARDAPREGVSGKLVVDSLPRASGPGGRLRPTMRPRSRSPGRVRAISSSPSAWGSRGRSHRRSSTVCADDRRRLSLPGGCRALPVHDDRHRRDRTGVLRAQNSCRARGRLACGPRTGSSGGGRRPRLEPPGGRRGGRHARPAVGGRAGRGAHGGNRPRRRRWRDERRLPPPGARRSTRWLRVRLRHPGNSRRRRVDERRRLRERLEHDRQPRPDRDG